MNALAIPRFIIASRQNKLKWSCVEVIVDKKSVGWIIFNAEGPKNGTTHEDLETAGGIWRLKAYSEQHYFPNKEKLQEFIKIMKALGIPDVVDINKISEWLRAMDTGNMDGSWRYDI